MKFLGQVQGSGREQADFFILLRSLREYRYPRWRSKLLLQAHFCDINVLESLLLSKWRARKHWPLKGQRVAWNQKEVEASRCAHSQMATRATCSHILAIHIWVATAGIAILRIRKGKKSNVVENVRLFCYPEGARLKTFLLTLNLCPLKLAPISKGRCQKLPRGFC